MLGLLLIIAFLNIPASAAPTVSPLELPGSADTGEPIHILVNISSVIPIRESPNAVELYYYNPGTGQESWVSMNLTEGNLSVGIWSYDIPAQSWSGELRCKITATDIAYAETSYPSSGYHVISITGEEQPKPFPWNIVLVVGFLAGAMVLTELVFKPGLYRPTGRDKAKKLEEEDRLREGERDAGKD